MSVLIRKHGPVGERECVAAVIKTISGAGSSGSRSDREKKLLGIEQELKALQQKIAADGGLARVFYSPHRTAAQKKEKAKGQEASTAWATIVFVIAATATLIAGVVLQQTSETMAKQIGLSGVVFGATILAAITALPEISTGFAAVKLGDYKMAVSDIFGGNAFLPVIFLVATLVSGKAVLPHATKADMYLTALGMLLTAVYIYGLIFRPRRQILRMGVDSFVVLVLYVLGVVGLFAIK